MSVRRWAALIAAVLFALAMTSCTLPGNQGTGKARSAPTTTPTPVLPTPTPTLALPGPIPTNCPLSVTHPRPVFAQQLAPVIGASPVWATWPTGPSRFHLVFASPPFPQNSNYDPRYGWQIVKMIWEVGPNYTHLITVQGHDLFDHTPLLFQFGGDTPTANAVLDSQHPSHPFSVVGDNWAEWGSVLVVPKAGCYSVQVSWPTGQWAVTFAAGA